jgi:hypothetical protein
MFNGLNNKLANVPTITGLSDITSDSVVSSNIDTSSLTVNGVDVTATINQVPINTADISALKQVTTGQSYTSSGDTTTFDNNVKITGSLSLSNNLYLTLPATTISQTELSYLDGVTSNIQTQFDAFPSSATIVTTNTNQTITGLKTFNGLNLNGNITLTTPAITLSQTELSYLDGVTSNIQTQLNTIPSSTNFVTTNTDQTITAQKTFSQAMFFSKFSGNMAMGQNTASEFGFNNFVSSGSFKFNANTSLAVPETIMKLSSGASEGLVEVVGNIKITSRAGGQSSTMSHSASGVLTIENSATSAVTQMKNNDSSGITRTSLMLQTTKQTVGGDGTDFNVVFTGDGSNLSTKTMRFCCNNSFMFLDCGTAYTGGSTPLVFRNGAATVVRVVVNDYGLDFTNTTGMIYGRNDSYDYTVQPTGAPSYPVGYTATYLETAATFTSGTAFNYTTVLPQLLNGVWLVQGTLTVNLGSGTWAGAPYIKIGMVTATGSSFYPATNSGAKIAMPSTAATPVIIPFTSTVIVKAISAVRAAIQGTIVMTVGSATKQLDVAFTKLA